jgi:uncharacterized protein
LKVYSTILFAVMMVAGCSPLAPRPDHSKYYILTPISITGDPIAGDATNLAGVPLVLGIGPIDFPEYLRRPQVVTRAAPNLIDLSAEGLWAEPLDKNFTRVLTENLAQLLNTQRMEKYPWSPRAHIDYQIVIDVQRFEKVAPDQTQLVARWIIKDGVHDRDLYASESNASAPVEGGGTGASMALSSDLAKLSTDIASQITLINQHRRTLE